MDTETDRVLQLGLNTITLACSYHAGKFISVKNKRIIFPKDGCLYFPMTWNGVIQPEMSELAQTDLLGALCKRDDISVNAWTVLLHNTHLGQRYPQFTAHNIFGDSYPYSLCPSHPEVRDYAIEVCAQLSKNYALQSLCLESPGWLPYVHGYHHEFAQVKPNPWLEAMLGLCFCKSCVHDASASGLDMAGLQKRLKKRVTDFLTSPIEPSPDMAAAWLARDCSEDDDLRAFLKWRCGVVTSLVRDIKGQVDTQVVVIPTIQKPHAASFFEGSHLKDLAEVSDGLEAPVYQNNPSSILADAWDVIRSVGDVTKVRCIIRPGHPDLSSSAEVAETVLGLQSLGIKDLSFYNYGLLRPHNLRWMQDALMQERR